MGGSPIGRHVSTPAELKERIEAERTGAPMIIYRDGGDHQRIVELAEPVTRITIGRRADNDIALEWDLEVSRLHAAIERIGGDWTITDDGLSSNGSYVNGERLMGRHRLEDGDTILVGKTPIVFCQAGAADSTSTVQADALPTRAELSASQRRVLVALCRPYSGGASFAIPATNQAIAEELFLGVDAVKAHLRALFHKFGIEDLPQNQKRAQLVALALRGGLVSERDFTKG
jgi:pSer/pThr/pTyr-binding forkhead associated (FHA) protein